MALSYPNTYIAPSGPYTAADIAPGEPYELSNGRKIECLPTGGRGAGPNALGVSALEWDPDVQEAGVDPGYSPNPKVLRAPDIGIGNVPNEPGWIKGVPLLAVEYADIGQDEAALQSKIGDLLRGGTRYLWVVRLTGVRRVEVYEPSKPVKTLYPGDTLTAPGVLRNAVPIEALYEREAAKKVTFRNLLQSYGYADLDAVRQEGADAGFEQGWDQGMERGFEKGLERGIHRGMERGMALGIEKGVEKGLRSAIRDIALLMGLGLDEERLAALEQMPVGELEALKEHLIVHKSWA